MHPAAFDSLLQELNPHLKVRRYHAKSRRNDGVYFGRKLLCAVPSGFIYAERHAEYHNYNPTPHRTFLEVFDILCKGGYVSWRDRWKFIHTK